MLQHVGLRTEQPFFLAAPERDADRATWLDADRLQNARRLHHRRAADRVVGRAGRRLPRIEVTAEHHHFVLLVAAGDFRDRVVRRPAFRIDLVDDVELEIDRGAVGQDARDAAVVLVAHDDRRHDLVDVVGAVVERDDLAVFTSGVVDADQHALSLEELVNPGVDFRSRHGARRDRRRRHVRRVHRGRRWGCSGRTARAPVRRRGAWRAA